VDIIASEMSVPNDKQDSATREVLEPPYDKALQLGLRPFAEFKEKVSPLFARIPADESQQYLQHIYGLAAKKVLMEAGRSEAENHAHCLAEEAGVFQSAIPNIELAAQSLSKAADALPQDFPARMEIMDILSQLLDIKRRVVDKGQELARFADVLRNLEGKDIAVRSASPSSLQYEVRLQKMDEVAPDLPSREQMLESYIRTLAGSSATVPYRYCLPSGRQLTVIDHWLIVAIDKSFTKAPPGKRLRFNRDEVICKTFEAALGERMRTVAGVKSVRGRKS
jgi:hypothetical protein